MRPRLLDRLVEQAAVGHEGKPQPEEVPFLLAAASRLEGIEVGQAASSMPAASATSTRHSARNRSRIPERSSPNASPPLP
ncbi:hypothetical protein [Streptomyces misionensis]|uniref:hypothetical protein n=1 Tax=Streptomyces misionensis TaxID=67331 RepID=UPI001648FAFB|nr:hypothetical protein [Streptomyces misionensis]